MLKQHLKSRKFFIHFIALAGILLIFSLQGLLGLTFEASQLAIVLPLILASYAGSNVMQKKYAKDQEEGA